LRGLKGENDMDRRLLLTGLLGVAGTAGIAAVLPRQAVAAGPLAPAPEPSSVLPDLSAPGDAPEPLEELGAAEAPGELKEGVELARHRWNHRRRRVRRWRNRCRWRRVNGRWRRRCRREPHWVWLWFWI
jgi:hypothetical protein